VHQHAQTDDDVEGSIVELEAVCIAAREAHLDPGRIRAAPCDSKHLSGCVNPCDGRTAQRKRDSGATGTGTNVEDGALAHRTDEPGNHMLLCVGNQPPDGPAEALSIKALCCRGIRVNRVTVVQRTIL
jgi:hypothetical protein